MALNGFTSRPKQTRSFSRTPLLLWFEPKREQEKAHALNNELLKKVLPAGRVETRRDERVQLESRES